MELLVRNTYAGEVTMEQLRREKADAQAGHGHGLPSCYAILRRHRHVFLNFRVTGHMWRRSCCSDGARHGDR